MKRKPKKPLHSRLIRKWDGTDLVPEPPAPSTPDVEAVAEVADMDAKPQSPRVPTLEDLFDDEEEMIEDER